MPTWLRKSLMVLVSIVTFGTVTPQALSNQYNEVQKQEKRDLFESVPPQSQQQKVESATIEEHDLFIEQMVKHAENQAYLKFGTKIKPIIEDEFRDIILPNIERAITAVAVQYPEEDLSQLIVSERPSGGTSEKIFHIFNQKTKSDIIRFHVRRDHPPQEAYVFNFHYHTEHDKYQKHHDLGVITWDKNTPPKWMS